MGRGVSLTVIIGLVAVALLSGCASTKGETAREYVDDASITTAVKAKLAADDTKTLTRVSVETVRGTVYLTGIVPTLEVKQRAADLAGQVRGARGVVNNLQVQS